MGPVVWGSSPLARGLQSTARQRVHERRIIPARAGFTGRAGAGRPGRMDHPRSRGVYELDEAANVCRWGSSPLARGLRRRQPPDRADGRIIPARAGFTPGRSASAPQRQDHPRSRGVYVGAVPVRGRGAGSSPLARGLRGIGHPHHAGQRIIPARAGFTAPSGPPPPGPADHPRSRGVYSASV